MAALDKLDKVLETVTTTTPQAVQPWSPELVKFLSVSVLLFTALTLSFVTYLLIKNKAPSSAVIKIFGVLTIISMSAVLVIVSYSTEQLTPIVGLFGAIAGYLLGKDSSNQNAQQGTPVDRAA